MVGPPGRQKKPTINDVASLAGVSKKTVSRVINRSSLVRAETRKQVEDIIAKIGFVPDPQARGLAFRHSFLIGMIYDNPNPQYVVNAQEGILEGLKGTDFELAVHRCDRTAPTFLENAQRFVERQKLFGVILTPSVSEDDRLADLLRQTDCAFIRIASVELDDRAHMIISNDRLGGLAAARHLTELGHTDIAFISGRPGFRSSEERRAGLEEGLREAGLELLPHFTFEGAYTFDSGLAAAERMLSLKNKPTAVFAANDEMAAGVLQAVRSRGLSVPADLSVMGYDDFNVATAVSPRLTTIHTPTWEIGRLAAAKLMHTREENPQFTVDETEPWLVIRESTAPLKR